MSIDRLTANTAASTYQAQNTTAAGASSTQATGKVHHGHHRHQTQQASDSVTLSDGAKSLAAARDAVQSTPDVRDEKVNAIKQQVADGTYNVPSSVLARNILSQTGSQQ